MITSSTASKINVKIRSTQQLLSRIIHQQEAIPHFVNEIKDDLKGLELESLVDTAKECAATSESNTRKLKFARDCIDALIYIKALAKVQGNKEILSIIENVDDSNHFTAEDYSN